MGESILSKMEKISLIRFPDGSNKIIRPNGEELNLFPDGKIQYKDKLGKIRDCN